MTCTLTVQVLDGYGRPLGAAKPFTVDDDDFLLGQVLPEPTVDFTYEDLGGSGPPSRWRADRRPAIYAAGAVIRFGKMEAKSLLDAPKDVGSNDVLRIPVAFR